MNSTPTPSAYSSGTDGVAQGDPRLAVARPTHFQPYRAFEEAGPVFVPINAGMANNPEDKTRNFGRGSLRERGRSHSAIFRKRGDWDKPPGRDARKYPGREFEQKAELAVPRPVANPAVPLPPSHLLNLLTAALPTLPLRPPHNRAMKPLVDHLQYLAADVPNLTQLRIVQYNILADCYASEAFFPYVKRKHLSFEYRCLLLFQELRSYDADIVALQEVDHFEDFFLPIAQSLGYESIFKKRPGSKTDGCAILFKKARFACHDQFCLDFNDLLRPLSSASTGSSVPSTSSPGSSPSLPPLPLPALDITKLMSSFALSPRVPSFYSPSASPRPKDDAGEDGVAASPAPKAENRYPTNNIAIGVLLSSSNGGAFWVINTHLYWDPHYPEVKIAQALRLKSFMAELKNKFGPRVGILLCGDLNSLPDSTVYRILTTPHANLTAEEKKNEKSFLSPPSGRRSVGPELGLGKPDQSSSVNKPLDFDSEAPPAELQSSKIEPSTGRSSTDAPTSGNISSSSAAAPDPVSSFCLKSIHFRSKEPPFTNYTHKFKGTLDYVFFSQENFSPICSLVMPPVSDLEADTALPNSAYPSDHIALVVDMQWKPEPMPAVPCPMALRCRRATCIFAHAELCSRGPNCNVAGCNLTHVSSCKYRLACRNPNCQYSHLLCPREKIGSTCLDTSCLYVHLSPLPQDARFAPAHLALELPVAVPTGVPPYVQYAAPLIGGRPPHVFPPRTQSYPKGRLPGFE